MKILPKRKKIVVDNHIKAFGEEQGGKIKINVKRHRGDKKELANTIFHESFHAAHPKATEKTTYKVTKTAMKKMPESAQDKLIAKVKGLHYKQGAAKRRFKMGRVHHKAGDFITKMNESKSSITKQTNTPSSRRIAFDGMI